MRLQEADGGLEPGRNGEWHRDRGLPALLAIFTVSKTRHGWFLPEEEQVQVLSAPRNQPFGQKHLKFSTVIQLLLIKQSHLHRASMKSRSREASQLGP